MKWPARAALALGLALLLLAALALSLAVSNQPALPPASAWALTELSRVKSVVGAEQGHGGDHERVLTLTSRDLEILLAQAGRELGSPRIDVELTTGRARVRATLALPANVWLNLDARLNDTYGMPGVDGLRIGSLPVPGWLAEALLDLALQRVMSTPQSEAAASIVQRVSFVRGQVKVAVAWRDDSPRVLAASLMAPDEQARLRAYADQLASVTAGLGGRSAVSMAELMAPMFALAQRRSAGGEAAAENRAALLVLAFYANGRSLAAIVPQARYWPLPRRHAVTLNGRPDSPLHFLISAALAAEAGGPLADAVGLYKEASDAQGGSGFSFNDLAADRAGTRFGLMAARAPQRLQNLLAGGVHERDLMPDVADLPDSLSAAEFAQRFGHVGTPEYERMTADIEARIDRCRVFEDPKARS